MFRSHNSIVSPSSTCALSAAAFAFTLGAAAPMAHAGSISANTNTYAGDVGAMKFPVGSFAISNYTAYRHGSEFINSEGVTDHASDLDLFTNIIRVDWMATKIFDMPLAISASLPYANPRSVELEGHEVSSESTFFSPNIFLTLGLIVDPQNERTLALSNYFFLPFGDYDATGANVATPHQTVIVPQIMYEEGLGKFSPALQNFWLDVFGGAAFHGDGDNPVTDSASGFGFDKTEQENSYDINFYLRYNWNPLMFAAVGIERSWGGEQIAKGGVLGEFQGDTSIGKDDFLKGHLQFAVPLSETMQLATDITHDFHREGGFKEDFTIEFRLSTFFLP